VNRKGFIAVDGEGIDDKYVLLAASTGNYVREGEGLSTKDCFDFLLSIPRMRGEVLVGFFFTYDVNMMLRDIPVVKLKKLWREKWLLWRGYILEWTPTKSFTVCRQSPKERVTVYDVGGFFQCSFVKALRTWQAAPKSVIERIESMKSQRQSFDQESMSDITTYCLEECQYLVSLMGKLESALVTAGLVPNTWQGAGSIAGKLLAKNKVKDHRKSDSSWGEEIHEAILHSYFGGRVELFQQGFHRTACAYDVTSAYPYAATMVPSLEGHFTECDHTPKGFGLCHVRWKLPDRTTVTPFPFRYKKGIYWPLNGEGIYHACEVREAQKAYGNYIQVLKGWEFHPANDTKPFAFIHDAFQERARLKSEGNPAEKAIKLGLNAMYGKLAQGIGYMGRPPAHRSYLWAGYLTALTRARMLNLAVQCPDDVIMIATDGIFMSKDPNWEVQDATLGALTKSEYPVLFTAQPGVYSDHSGTVNKTRGFSVSEVSFDLLKRGFQDRGPFFVAHYKSRRFQGLGSSLQRTDMDTWRSWPETNRKLSLHPSRKWILDYNDSDDWEQNPQEYVRHYPGTVEGVSEPYIPKTPDLENPGALQFMELQEQPDPGERYHVK
jgi:DNA polymerase type B, organellar and viral